MRIYGPGASVAQDLEPDGKGPEPENVVVLRVGDRQLAMIALSASAASGVYDVSDPEAPVFQQYLTTRVSSGSVIAPDCGPEGTAFAPDLSGVVSS